MDGYKFSKTIHYQELFGSEVSVSPFIDFLAASSVVELRQLESNMYGKKRILSIGLGQVSQDVPIGSGKRGGEGHMSVFYGFEVAKVAYTTRPVSKEHKGKGKDIHGSVFKIKRIVSIDWHEIEKGKEVSMNKIGEI